MTWIGLSNFEMEEEEEEEGEEEEEEEGEGEERKQKFAGHRFGQASRLWIRVVCAI